MVKIEKKIWPEFFQAILDGKKTYEIRLADFEVNEGDTLLLKEWDPEKKEYTGREVEKEVINVNKTKDIKFWPKEVVDEFGLQIIGLK